MASEDFRAHKLYRLHLIVLFNVFLNYCYWKKLYKDYSKSFVQKKKKSFCDPGAQNQS